MDFIKNSGLCSMSSRKPWKASEQDRAMGLVFCCCFCFLCACFILRLSGKRLDMRKCLEKSLGGLLSGLCRNQGRNVGSFARGDKVAMKKGATI